MITRMPEAKCPGCGIALDGAFDPHGETAPSPGDFSICFYCQGLFIFTDELTLRHPEEEDIADMPTLPISIYQRLLKQVKEKHA